MSRKPKIGIMCSGGETAVYDFTVSQIISNFDLTETDITIIVGGFRGAHSNRILPVTATLSEQLQHSPAGIITKGCRGYNAFDHLGHIQKIAKFLATFDATFIVGGDGSMGQAYDFVQAYPKLNFIGLVGTMDGAAFTDITLGEATAAKAIYDEAKASFYSALSLDRKAIVEGMGRYCGEPLVDAAILLNLLGIPIAAVLTPQYTFDMAELTKRIVSTDGIVLVSEGISLPGRDISDNSVGMHATMRGAANGLAELLKPALSKHSLDVKSTTAGYIQRAGDPHQADIDNSILMAKAAVERFRNGEKNTVIVGHQSEFIPSQVVLKEDEINSVDIETFVTVNRYANYTFIADHHPRQVSNLKYFENQGVYVGEKICEKTC